MSDLENHVANSGITQAASRSSTPGEIYAAAMQRACEASNRQELMIFDLEQALKGLLEEYVQLVNCGDCGSWDPEKVATVRVARAVLARRVEERGAD